jgi:RNB domain
MSLIMNRDSFALSLGVELNADGSIDDSTILVTPSLIRVSYRLTYDEVDEMLEEGIGYNEEWELGALLNLATTRRKYRCSQGSSEGSIPTPIPQNTIRISEDDSAPDGIHIEVSVQSSHNAGANQTAGAETAVGSKGVQVDVEPVSSAFTLVTESMIVAGEAIGRWKVLQDTLWEDLETSSGFRNEIRLPFRAQKKPGKRSNSKKISSSKTGRNFLK